MIAYENKDKSVLVFTGDKVLFSCGICGESHKIDKCDVNETIDKQCYIVQCPETGQLVDWDKEKDCVK
jgi:hypothetical protein